MGQVVPASASARERSPGLPRREIFRFAGESLLAPVARPFYPSRGKIWILPMRSGRVWGTPDGEARREGGGGAMERASSPLARYVFRGGDGVCELVTAAAGR